MLVAACQPAASGSPSAGASAEGSAAAGSYLERAEAGEFDGTSVEILAQWVDAEAENFEGNLTAFAERTGIDISYEGITDYETALTVRVDGDDPPDIAQTAQPGKMREFQADGHLIDLSTFMDMTAFEESFGSWNDLVTVDGGVYGVPYQAAFKSIVWYPNAAFEEAGYEIPQTWDDLLALTDQIREDGTTPWCIGIEHGDASGWAATDWLEDIMLRTASTETYDAWINHDIPFNDPAVLHAADLMSEIWFTEGNVYGGTDAINATFVGDSMNPMFDDAGPQCFLHHQASWIYTFWPGFDATTTPPTYEFEPGVDASFFYMPPIDDEFGKPALGAGDMMLMFNDRDEVRAVMEFLATPEAAEHWISTGSFV
jgi:alpha-glucoside transport system substrate-binding protein